MGRPSSTARARRLLALASQLAKGQTLSLERVAAAVGTTCDQVSDDLEALSLCGLPPFSPDTMIEIYVDDETGEITVFSRPDSLDKHLRLAPSEARALAAALEAAGYGPDDPVRARLEEAAGRKLDAGLVAMAVGAEGLAGMHALLTESIRERDELEIEYQPGGAEAAQTRPVSPWHLEFFRGSWYLTAWCERAGAIRHFRIDRIRSAEPTGREARAAADPVPLVAEFLERRLPRATVRFVPGSDPDERAWPGSTFCRAEDGHIDAKVPYADPSWLARMVASQLGAAEVTAPEDVRCAVSLVAARIIAEQEAPA